MHRNTLTLFIDNERISFENTSNCLTLLDFLRLHQQKTGVKEGCNEGDCGACTVLIGQWRGGEFSYQAINSCIKLVNSCDLTHIVTIHHLKREGDLHPIQKAFVENHASQCGFCTPGFIMSLYALWLNELNPSEKRIEEVIAGNLCRCTGYEAIIKAAKKAFLTSNKEDVLTSKNIALELKAIESTFKGDGYLAPRSLKEALTHLNEVKPLIINGLTDVGLWITKEYQRPKSFLDISRIDELQNIQITEKNITLGACVSLTRVKALFETLHPQLYEVMRRFGGEQVRNSGTIGGNIANGSPIGDLPPVLIALNASIQLISVNGTREMPLEAFFIDYKKQAREENELLVNIIIPLPLPKKLFIHKLSKRYEEDISTLLIAFSQNEKNYRIAFGGMAGIPKRAFNAEKALKNGDINGALKALEQDFSPLSDVRASSDYRKIAAQNLLERALKA